MAGVAPGWVSSTRPAMLLLRMITLDEGYKMKICSKCKIEKELDEFRKSKQNKDGHAKQCKICVSVAEGKVRASSEGKKKKALSDKFYAIKNKEKLKVYKAKYYQINKKKIKEERVIDAEHIKEINKRRSILPDYIGNYLNKLPPVDKAKFNNVLTVICKTCGGRFSPTRTSLDNRVRAYEGKKAGECNLYCSDRCKSSCLVFNFASCKHIDPRSKLSLSVREKARNCQTDHLKKLQCDEVGYNYCERCGDIISVDLHHTQPVGSKDSVSSAGHLLLCPGCHVKLEATC